MCVCGVHMLENVNPGIYVYRWIAKVEAGTGNYHQSVGTKILQALRERGFCVYKEYYHYRFLILSLIVVSAWPTLDAPALT